MSMYPGLCIKRTQATQAYDCIVAFGSVWRAILDFQWPQVGSCIWCARLLMTSLAPNPLLGDPTEAQHSCAVAKPMCDPQTTVEWESPVGERTGDGMSPESCSKPLINIWTTDAETRHVMHLGIASENSMSRSCACDDFKDSLVCHCKLDRIVRAIVLPD